MHDRSGLAHRSPRHLATRRRCSPCAGRTVSARSAGPPALESASSIASLPAPGWTGWLISARCRAGSCGSRPSVTRGAICPSGTATGRPGMSGTGGGLWRHLNRTLNRGREGWPLRRFGGSRSTGSAQRPVPPVRQESSRRSRDCAVSACGPPAASPWFRTVFCERAPWRLWGCDGVPVAGRLYGAHSL